MHRNLYVVLVHIYHGSRWMQDERFAAPMIICNAGHIFIYDFVQCHSCDGLIIAKVSSFFKKVKLHGFVIVVSAIVARI